MEFPHLGKHCSEKYCNKLDFLPMKCDACGEIFCSEHFSYQTHSCHSAYKKDVQVPICPLCGEPVPTARDVSPDVTVGAHIDQFCKSERKKIYTNRCSFKTCKKKELVPFSCGVCKRNYCLKHRHTVDHECQGASSSGAPPARSLAAQAAVQRQQQQSVRSVPLQSTRSNASQLATAVQGNMSEDEALARALALSLQEEEDERTRAERDAANNGRNPPNRSGIAVGGNSAKDKCNLS
ncbi:AN1-type zinc finger protein 2A [Aedes aegypti]|uniref:AN1-type domain-containing protein n=1 Tax=Aedes aegypti TaxID=7159 RepID=A0A1S4G260_AEDAE|nr:AN1-type zinc finger protein 2A [Aedes aegypti]